MTDRLGGHIDDIDAVLADVPVAPVLALLRDAHFGVLLLDLRGRILSANRRFGEMTGYSVDALCRRAIHDITHPDEVAGTRQRLRQFEEGARLHLWIDKRFVHADGSTRWMRVTVRRIHGDRLLLVVFEVGDAQAAQAALERSESRFRLAVEGSGAGLWDWDLRADIVDYSPAFERLLRYAGEDFHRDFRYRDRLHPEDRESALHAVSRALTEGAAFDCHYRLLCFDGHYRWFQGRGMAFRGADGVVERFTGVLFDWHERREQEERLRESERQMAKLARHDALTQLPNRLHWQERLMEALADAQRQGWRLALLMLDLDRFKDVNDSLGHAVGDELLTEMAARLQRRLRAGDVLARWGGDEFVVLLRGLSAPEDAARVAKELIDTVSQPWRSRPGLEFTLGTSIGIALYPEHGRDEQSLMQAADAALYEAKGSGRGAYRYYSEELTRQATLRLELESRLRQAVRDQAFTVVFQPQRSTQQGHVIGAEALLRWNDGVLGQVPPDRFIPVAEACGLMDDLGAWVLVQACQAARRWRQAGWHDARVAVNVSSRQFQNRGFVERVRCALADEGLPTDALELEVTETVLMDSGDETQRVLREVEALGVSMAVDDFGIGHSSLAYLKRLAVDTLKIDRTFVRDIDTDPDDRQICAAIIAMAHNLRLTVVAEGVETESQWQILSALGCDRYQGYWRGGYPTSEQDVLRQWQESAGAG